MPDLTGQSLDRYHILEPLGEGGMAVVYKAFDTRLERNVAIKVITPSQEHSEQFLKRFEREARALAQLSHPNIIKVLDYGEVGGLPYLVMEYLPGGTLKQRLTPQPMDWRQAAGILIPMAEALHYAHQQGIIHRDVKPSNILLTASGEPLLTDFGIAKILQGEEVTADLTGTGVGIGTPEYMAPEQGAGHGVDQRADIYALGVIFYEMVTGRKPYEAVTPMAVLLQKMTEPLPRPREINPALPEAVERVLVKALAKDPANRYQTAAEFALALQNLGHPEEERAGPRPAPTLFNRRNLSIAGAVLFAFVLITIAALGSTRLLAALNLGAPDATSTPRPALPTRTPQPAPPGPGPTLPFPTDTPSSTAARAGGEWIAFASARGGNNDIYIMKTDGSQVTQLTTSTADDRVPSWSPDGQHIAYQSTDDGDADLYVLTITNWDPVQVTRPAKLTENNCLDGAPVWSPDGNKLAYYSECDGNREIYTRNADGSGTPRQLTDTGYVNWFPTWSPDGRKITYSSSRSGKYEVFVMSAEGENPTALARGCVSSFSPDGSMILFSQYCTDDGALYLMNSDGTHLDTFINHPDCSDPESPAGLGCSNPSWSPDGTQVAFQRLVDGNYDIWKVNLDGSGLTRLTDDPGRDAGPVWQPFAPSSVPPASAGETGGDGGLSVRVPTLNEIRAEVPVSIWDANQTDLMDMHEPGTDTHAGRAAQGEEYLFPIYWCARNPDQLEGNLEQIETSFLINGEVIPEEEVFSYNLDIENGWSCNYRAVVLGGWLKNEQYTLEIRRVLAEDLWDGESNYSGGEYIYTMQVAVP